MLLENTITHFNLPNVTISRKLVYSVGEMNSHRCQKRYTSTEHARTMEANHLDLHLA
jgi:hypothetical protein